MHCAARPCSKTCTHFFFKNLTSYREFWLKINFVPNHKLVFTLKVFQQFEVEKSFACFECWTGSLCCFRIFKFPASPMFIFAKLDQKLSHHCMEDSQLIQHGVNLDWDISVPSCEISEINFTLFSANEQSSVDSILRNLVMQWCHKLPMIE